MKTLKKKYNKSIKNKTYKGGLNTQTQDVNISEWPTVKVDIIASLDTMVKQISQLITGKLSGNYMERFQNIARDTKNNMLNTMNMSNPMNMSNTMNIPNAMNMSNAMGLVNNIPNAMNMSRPIATDNTGIPVVADATPIGNITNSGGSKLKKFTRTQQMKRRRKKTRNKRRNTLKKKKTKRKN